MESIIKRRPAVLSTAGSFDISSLKSITASGEGGGGVPFFPGTLMLGIVSVTGSGVYSCPVERIMFLLSETSGNAAGVISETSS